MTLVVRLVVILLCLSCTVFHVSSQTLRNNTQAEKATVSGKVTLKGKAAAGVVVILRRDDAPGNPYENAPRATTDQTGIYKISDVTPGSYQVSVLAPAYVIADSAESRVRMLVIGAGENVENINFTIVRGGVITGKVTDSEGRPVVEQLVFAYRAEVFSQQQRRGSIVQSASATTDDRGIYRMFGVTAGQYKVAVGRGEEMFQGSMAIGRASYQQTFHPNVSDQTKATVVDASEGSEATGVDIAVGPKLQTFSASGRTVDGERFTPIPNLRFGLQRVRGERMEFVNTLASSNNNGDFVAEGLLPGKYRAFAFSESNSARRIDPVEFEIVDQDVSGITIKVSKGGSISGVVVVENEDRRAMANFPNLQISAYVTGPPGGAASMGQSASSSIGPDGSFNIGGLPSGNASVNVYSRVGRDQRWSMTRIERDGVVLKGAIEVKDGEQVTGVRVVVTYGTAILQGVVIFANGEQFKGGGVSVRLSKLGETKGMPRPTQVDPRGRFIVEGIPAGVYDLVVMYAAPNIKPRTQRQQVTLQDNTTTEVTVTLDMSPEPKQ